MPKPGRPGDRLPSIAFIALAPQHSRSVPKNCCFKGLYEGDSPTWTYREDSDLEVFFDDHTCSEIHKRHVNIINYGVKSYVKIHRIMIKSIEIVQSREKSIGSTKIRSDR